MRSRVALAAFDATLCGCAATPRTPDPRTEPVRMIRIAGVRPGQTVAVLEATLPEVLRRFTVVGDFGAL